MGSARAVIENLLLMLLLVALLPLAILVVGAPVALLVRIVLALVDRL